jgi:cell division protein FtsB
MTDAKKWINVTIFIASFYLLFTGNRGLWNLYELHQEKKSLSEQVFILKNQINQYQEEYQFFSKSTSVFEKQAREELNLVKPGELVYKFSKNVPQ